MKYKIASSEETLSLGLPIINYVLNNSPCFSVEYFYVSSSGNISFYKDIDEIIHVWNKGIDDWEVCNNVPQPLHRIDNICTVLEDSEIQSNSLQETKDIIKSPSVTLSELFRVLQDNLSERYFVGTPPVGEVAFYINFSPDKELVVVHTMYDQAQSSIFNPLVSNSCVAMTKLSEYLNDLKITPQDIKLN